MNDEKSLEIRRRAGEFFQSADFDPYFEQLHPFKRGGLTAAWLLMPFLFQGAASAGAWRKLESGDVRSKKLRRRYAELGKTGDVIFTYVVVGNQALMREPGVVAPALTVGNFNGGADDQAIMGLVERLAPLTLRGGGTGVERKVSKLLSDLEYRFQRRRVIPKKFSGGCQVTAFDLMVVGEFLPTETLQIEAIPCLAEPGKRGLIAMIPWFVIGDVLGGGERQKGEPPPIPRTDFASGYLCELLAMRKGELVSALLSPKANAFLADLWEAYHKEMGEPVDAGGGERPVVNVFKEERHIMLFLTFPKPTAPGDVYFGVIVAGPFGDENLSAESIERVKSRYFVLCKASGGTKVEEWADGRWTQLGDGPEAEEMLFGEWVSGHVFGRSRVVSVRQGDEGMAEAMKRAKAELPELMPAVMAGTLEGFTVKIRVADGDENEFFWLSDTVYRDGEFSGAIDADPQLVSTVARGEGRTVGAGDVVDWMFVRDGKMYGNYTLRALLPSMPPGEAAKYGAVLGEEGTAAAKIH